MFFFSSLKTKIKFHKKKNQKFLIQMSDEKKTPSITNKQWPLKSIFRCETKDRKNTKICLDFFPKKTNQNRHRSKTKHKNVVYSDSNSNLILFRSIILWSCLTYTRCVIAISFICLFVCLFVFIIIKRLWKRNKEHWFSYCILHDSNCENAFTQSTNIIML